MPMTQETRPEPDARATLRSGARFLVGAACLVVVIAGLQAARPVLIPVLIAAFLAFVCIHPMRRLERLGLPRGLALAIVMLGLLLSLALVSVMLGNSVASFTASSGDLNARFTEIVERALARLERLGIDIPRERVGALLETDALLRLLTGLLSEIVSALSSILVILLIAVFLILEAQDLPGKLGRIHDTPPDMLSGYQEVTDRVFTYVSMKSLTSLLTGALAAALFAAFGVEFPLLLGLLVFLFNYIPTVGSVLAAVPPVLLCLIGSGLGTTLALLACYMAVSFFIGNVLEPRLLGRKLGLSPAVVLLSLIFWNWVLGPVGMLLSPPLTMIVKILMEHSADLRGMAILLGSGEEVRRS